MAHQFRIFVGVVFLGCLATGSSAADAVVDVFAQNQKLGRGVNILGYDPIWRSREEARFQAKHFRLLKQAGFDSVRINLHPFRHMKDEAGLTLPNSWFETLDWAVAGATANGLTVVLDLHEFGAMSEAPEENHDKFLAVWRQLSAHCQKASDQIVFEILNEPSKKLTPILWNQYLREALAIIRESNPTRTVIVGPPFWNAIDHLHELELPTDDRHLIVTVHYYTPMEFTHQGAPWSSHKDKSNVDWLGTAEEQAAVHDDLAKAAAWAREKNRPIFLGEFGAYDKAPIASRVRYTGTVARTAESFGWSWAYWQFDSDFILYDVDRDAWVQPIRDALVPPADSELQSGRYQGRPFQSNIRTFPSRTECEFYDVGGEGVASHETTSGHGLTLRTLAPRNSNLDGFLFQLTRSRYSNAGRADNERRNMTRTSNGRSSGSRLLWKWERRCCGSWPDRNPKGKHGTTQLDGCLKRWRSAPTMTPYFASCSACRITAMNSNTNQFRTVVGALMLAVIIAGPSYCATTESVGIFESQSDVGKPVKRGGADYDPERQEYRVTGSGKNMWFDKDEFHFVWKRMKGDFILRTQAEFPGQGVEAHRKLGWMVRSTLDTNAPHINAVVHGDGLISLQFRQTVGGATEEIKSTITAANVIQLERNGDRYTMSVAGFGAPFVTSHLDNLKLGDDVYVGLFVCSHNAEVIETAVFRNVRITVPAPENFVPYRDYIGSRLETLDVDTGQRRVLLDTSEPIEAPNWTPDGTTLIYNSKGRLFRFPLREKKPFLLDTGFANRNNNDHVLSFDGKTLGISHHAQDTEGRSVIYTLPATGGKPKRVTDKAPSYLHGWSPDGSSLVYTGERNGEFDIYRIQTDGGEEVRLTTSQGLDDGSEYTPDGKYIYFNSARTGTMQVWRMKPDGSDQQQLTHDDLNDWFPHVSPDGRRVVFLSFSKDVEPNDHPFYKHIYLRMMPIDGGQSQVIAYLYGGQGTINVPSWAPDSRHLAFVSNSNRRDTD